MPDKRTDLELKKQEILYLVVKEEVVKIEDRFDKIEEKANRQFTIITVLLGIAAFGISDFIKILPFANCQFLPGLFVICYAVLVFLIITTMYKHLQTLKYMTLKHLDVSQELASRVEACSYATSLYRLTQENLGIVKENLKVLELKVKRGESAFKLTKSVIWFWVFSAMLYIVLHLFHPEIWQS